MIGRAPVTGTGKALQDSDWLLGLAGGDNNNVQNITASTTHTSAGATPMGGVVNGVEAAMVALTVANASDAASLPQAVHGKYLMVLNISANNGVIYASPNTNKITAALDTIIGAGLGAAANVTLNADTAALFFCPVDGTWARL